MEQFQVAVVGAGLVGAAVARELHGAGVKTVVLEAAPQIAAGASRSNSGILCTGFDAAPQSLEARMILAQGRRWRRVFDELRIPHRTPGALVLANSESQLAALNGLAENAERNGVDTEIVTGERLRRFEPAVVAEAALLVPGEAITDPYEAVRRLLTGGPEVRLSWPVTRIEQSGASLRVVGPAGTVSADYAVNCAGLYADEVAGDDSFRISPRRGEFVVYGRADSISLAHILLPVPNERTKGVLVFPTVHGNICAGPSAVDQVDKDDWKPRASELEAITEQAVELFPPLKNLEVVGSWAGLRPVGHPHSYIVDWSERTPSLLNIAGIRSTGLSSCLGLSRLAVELLVERGLPLACPPEPDSDSSRSGSTPDVVAPADGHYVGDGEQKPWWERLRPLE
ncbi:MAG: FAD-dependent oxidoreductase [Trueperaceae bacterium]